MRLVSWPTENPKKPEVGYTLTAESTSTKTSDSSHTHLRGMSVAIACVPLHESAWMLDYTLAGKRTDR